jgi:hypothetical protein
MVPAGAWSPKPSIFVRVVGTLGSSEGPEESEHPQGAKARRAARKTGNRLRAEPEKGRSTDEGVNMKMQYLSERFTVTRKS